MEFVFVFVFFLFVTHSRQISLEGDQSVARPLPTHRTTQTQNKWAQTPMPRVGFEPTISVFERAKMVRALDQWSSTWDMITTGDTRIHLNGYVKISYISRNETQEPLKP
jgi:hypothetical protein